MPTSTVVPQVHVTRRSFRFTFARPSSYARPARPPQGNWSAGAYFFGKGFSAILSNLILVGFFWTEQFYNVILMDFLDPTVLEEFLQQFATETLRVNCACTATDPARYLRSYPSRVWLFFFSCLWMLGWVCLSLVCFGAVLNYVVGFGFVGASWLRLAICQFLSSSMPLCPALHCFDFSFQRLVF